MEDKSDCFMNIDNHTSVLHIFIFIFLPAYHVLTLCPVEAVVHHATCCSLYGFILGCLSYGVCLSTWSGILSYNGRLKLHGKWISVVWMLHIKVVLEHVWKCNLCAGNHTITARCLHALIMSARWRHSDMIKSGWQWKACMAMLSVCCC